MQDQNHPEFSKEFMDISWEKMRQQLDTEMPVEHKRRRGIWWWWTGLAAGVLIGTVAMWLWLVPNTTTITYLPIPVEATTSTITTNEVRRDLNNPVTESVKTTEITIHTTDKNTKINTDQVINNNVTPQMIGQSNTTMPFAVATDNAINNELINTNAIAKGNAEMKSQNADNQIFVENETTEVDNIMEQNTVTHSSSVTTHTTIDNFSFLPYIHIPALESLNSSNEDVTLSAWTTPAVQPSRLRYGFHAGVNGNMAFNSLGYQAGIGIQWKSKHKWGWTAGVQYAKRYIDNLEAVAYSEAVLIEPSDEVDIESGDPDDPDDPQGGFGTDGEDNTATTNGEMIISSVDTSYLVSVPSTPYYFIELPVQLTYPINPRWAVGVGARLAYHTRPISFSKNDELASHTENTLAGANIDQDKNIFNDVDYTYIQNEYQLPILKNWNVAPTASLQYHLTPRMDIRAQYAYTNWIKADSRTSNTDTRIQLSEISDNKSRVGMSEWQVSLHYYFK